MYMKHLIKYFLFDNFFICKRKNVVKRICSGFLVYPHYILREHGEVMVLADGIAIQDQAMPQSHPPMLPFSHRVLTEGAIGKENI